MSGMNAERTRPSEIRIFPSLARFNELESAKALLASGYSAASSTDQHAYRPSM